MSKKKDVIFEKNKFWDTNYYNNPCLTEDITKNAEEKLGVKLPVSFLKLLQIQNGGYTKDFVFPMKVKTSWSENHVPLEALFGIVLEEDSGAHNIMDSAYLINEWGLPEKQILICGNGPWWLTLDYRKGNIPSVRWIDIDCEEDIHVASSFEEFIEGLVQENEIENK